VAESIGDSRAVKIFICNLMTQPGETDGYSARQHLEVVHSYAPEIRFDYTVVNDRPVTPEQAEAYAAEGARQIGLTDHLLERTFGGETEIVRADLLDDGEKVRHSPRKLARVIAACYEKSRAHAGVAHEAFTA
jgi:uncharacterized cofD-like protein